ncbi:ArnT family glycosyltransferase [Granulicella paludicola]|uniref:ArnT family glycosyltransferase n=1 Tax=Granulicella paludicola TaxID=474951 RepID=UPI0021E0A0A5|nr:glycosyltransferase family 39 protein [Granulicella paludicola]
MTTTIVRPSDPTLRSALRLALIFGTIKLLFQFALTLYTQHIGYGYFRDEFYYIACGRHLAWGFVDHGPIVAIQARLGELLFGDSLFGIRILSAVAGAITVFLTGIIAWAMNGHRSAQALAMFAILLTPQYIGVDGFLSMNSYEPVFWMLCALAVLMLLRGASASVWWTAFGLSAGIGLLNKPSMTFFLIAVGVGVLCTSARRVLWSRWAIVGIVLMFAIALPNLLWQIHNHWPTLEFLQNGRARGKNTILNPLQFFLAQFVMLAPHNALLWITGIVALLRAKSTRLSKDQDARWFGITFLVFYVMMDAIHAKDYYLEGIYPALFAAGAIAWEHRYRLSRRVFEGRIVAFPILETVFLVLSLMILPMASPVLPPAQWVRYTNALHLHHAESETSETGPLPQFFADRFGWQQQVDLVTQAYRSLTPTEQQHVCLFGSNYGEAGAIDFFNGTEHLGLPPAISGQNSYWGWGMHGCDTNIVIAVVGDTRQQLATKYEHVDLIGQIDSPYAMPFERHHHIWLLRGDKRPPPFDWRDERFYF